MRDSDIGTVVGGVILALIILAVVIFISAAIGCWLWNIVMVGVFNLPTLTYWEMLALIWLAHMIFPSSINRSKE